MLETRELLKIYKPKKGVPVTALNKVNLKFPETGMVFLLGKSGSGKSTLLNLLGGLDGYDSGEIIIKGVSSKDFKQKHFDSYRNTYVGFIFQEYNVLDDFSVGANIALAIELQNRKATDSEVNDILKEVDLEGFGNRKPNELSGGQKQRVAIARALVKKPRIIMADEPTGALDSNTGKAIFDTLKKLSKEKLVIVVSHDREFAENYADRIIELADGVVISDVELDNSVDSEEENKLLYDGNTITVPTGYHITEEDRLAINKYIEELSQTAEITVATKTSNKKFKNTDQSRIMSFDGSAFKLIKSKLPLKNAFKIGASSLKYKKIRLTITILLSCVAFGLFGLADTFGAYNHINTCTNSLIDTNVQYVATGKSKLMGEGMDSYWRDYGYKLSKNDLAEIEKETNVKMHGVYVPYNESLDFQNHINPEIKLSETDYRIYNPYFTGFAEINESVLNDMGFELLAGNLPDGAKNEIAISEYVFEIFKKANYTDGVLTTLTEGKQGFAYTKISAYSDIIGKIININNTEYTVTGVVNTNTNLERYLELTKEKEYKSNAEELVDMILYSEFATSSAYSYSSIAMVGEGMLDKMMANRPPMASLTEGYLNFFNNDMDFSFNNMVNFSDIGDEKIVWLGEPKTSLGEKEIIVTTDSIYFFNEDMTETADYAEFYKSKLSDKTDYTASMNVFADNDYKNEEGYKLVGIIITEEGNSKLSYSLVCGDKLFKTFADSKDNIYEFCVGAMPKEKADVKNLVSFCYREDSRVRFQIQNSVTFELDSINEGLKVCSVIFLYIGLGFALFAALMLANFIGTSISYKKQEIGILRAIGSRSNDVFRIFFAESFVIAMINFLLSAIGVGVVTAIINYVIRNQVGLLVTVLTFSIRQVILLLFVSILVAFLASFFPVKRIASKKPIDAIRNR